MDLTVVGLARDTGWTLPEIMGTVTMRWLGVFLESWRRSPPLFSFVPAALGHEPPPSPEELAGAMNAAEFHSRTKAVGGKVSNW